MPTATPTQSRRPIEASGTFTIGDRTIHRLGYGAMQITIGSIRKFRPTNSLDCSATFRKKGRSATLG